MKRRQLSVIGILLVVCVMIGSLFVVTVKASGRVDPRSIQQQETVSGQGTRSPTDRTPSYGETATSQSGQVPDSPIYVALGDSVAAGAGLPVVNRGTSLDATCSRSLEAYPYQIAEALQLPVTHLACSGAKVDEGIYGTQVRRGQRVPAQLDVAFAGGAPTIMTATIGANDARWTQFIRQCYITRCGTGFDDARLKVYRADLRIELTRMLAEIRLDSAGDPPRVFMSGYYDPLESVDCLANGRRITATEAVWLKTQTANLNQAIQSVIPLFSFATYVPLDFTGHELCSSDPWVQGIDASAPVHPTATGQSAIAQAYLEQIGVQ